MRTSFTVRLILRIMTFEYLRQSWFFFKTNIATLAKINLPFLLAFNILFTQVDISTSSENSEALASSLLWMSMLNLLMMPIYWGATITFMQSTVEGPVYTVSQSLAASLKLWPKLFLVFLLTSACIFFGIMALVIPGLYIAVRLSIADYLCVIEKKTVFESLQTSWKLTDQYGWTIFQGVAFILCAILLTKTIVYSLLETYLSQLSFLNPIINSAFDLLNVLVMIYGFRIYCLIKQEL